LVKKQSEIDVELNKGITGNYPKGRISVQGSTITVKMKNITKPDALGTINGNIGTLTLDKKTFNIEYDPVKESIYFEPRSSGIQWKKVKKNGKEENNE